MTSCCWCCRRIASSTAKRREPRSASKRCASPLREEVEQWTGLQPGSIPPFGSLFNLPTCCDPALARNESINFNAGDHCISVQMSYADFVALEKPRMVSVT